MKPECPFCGERNRLRLAGNCWLQGTVEEHAEDAYNVADAMLAKRAK